jgi:CheY-like chemotaxis protein
MKGRNIEGCRVLVVEDEMLIALLIEDALVGLGCEIVGPVAKLENGLQMADEAQFDIAILDVTIRGGKVYGDWALPESLRDRPRLMKPFTMLALEDQIRKLCADVSA